MAKKKDVQEELMKTHVLNLNEIREAEKKDKIEKRKKTPIALLILGIILIIIGISYSIFLTHKKLNAPQKTEKEKNEIERVRKVFEKHIQQMTAYDLVWSDKVGYVWLAISIDPVYIDTGNWIESAAGLCYECLNDIALDVFGMTGNDHDFEDADPLELAEIKRRWKPYIDQLPEYAYLCDELLSGRK